MNIMNNIENLESAIEIIMETRNKVKKEMIDGGLELSKLDLEILDLMHYIEFNELDDDNLLKITKELKSLQLKRRNIKNQLELSRTLLSIIGSNKESISNLDKLNNDLLKFNKSKIKKYKPRIRKDLFNN